MHNKFKSNCDILIVLNSLVSEGCPQLALDLSKYWSSKKLKVQIICFDEFPLDLIQEFEEIDIKVNFYKNLKKGKGKSEALVETIKFFKNNPNKNLRSPYIWAAFQLSGDWRPIKF